MLLLRPLRVKSGVLPRAPGFAGIGARRARCDRRGRVAASSCCASSPPAGRRRSGAGMSRCAPIWWRARSARSCRTTELQADDIPDIPFPRHLRPCCAFGAGLRVTLMSLPVPGVELGNIMQVDDLGLAPVRQRHDRLRKAAGRAGRSINNERNGLVLHVPRWVHRHGARTRLGRLDPVCSARGLRARSKPAPPIELSDRRWSSAESRRAGRSHCARGA